MDKLVRRITQIRRAGDKSEPTVIYEKTEAGDDVSVLTNPAEKVAKRILTADQAFTEEALRLHEKSARERDGGWLFDAPINIMKAHRKAFNEARKAVPFRLVPKLPKVPKLPGM
jgi:hypothetical protein